MQTPTKTCHVSQAWGQPTKSFSSGPALSIRKLALHVRCRGRAFGRRMRAYPQFGHEGRRVGPFGADACRRGIQASLLLPSADDWTWGDRDLADRTWRSPRRSPHPIDRRQAAWKQTLPDQEGAVGKVGEHRAGGPPSKNPDGTLKPFYLKRSFKYLPSDRFELEIVNSADPYEPCRSRASRSAGT